MSLYSCLTLFPGPLGVWSRSSAQSFTSNKLHGGMIFQVKFSCKNIGGISLGPDSFSGKPACMSIFLRMGILLRTLWAEGFKKNSKSGRLMWQRKTLMWQGKALWSGWPHGFLWRAILCCLPPQLVGKQSAIRNTMKKWPHTYSNDDANVRFSYVWIPEII